MRRILSFILLSSLIGCYTPPKIREIPPIVKKSEESKNLEKVVVSNESVIRKNENYADAKKSFEDTFKKFSEAYNKARDWSELAYLQRKIENKIATYKEGIERGRIRDKLEAEGELIWGGKEKPPKQLLVDWWEYKSKKAQENYEKCFKDLSDAYKKLDKILEPDS